MDTIHTYCASVSGVCPSMLLFFFKGCSRSFIRLYSFQNQCVQLETVLIAFLLRQPNPQAKATYNRKHLIWGSCFPRVRVMAILVGSMAVGRQAWHWRSSWELTSVHECEAEKKRTIWECHGFYKPQSLPQWHAFSYKATTLNLSQTVPPTVEKTFKQMSLKKTFSFKLPHCKPWLP